MEDCIGLKVVSDFIELISLRNSTAPNASTSYFHTDHFEKEGGNGGYSKSKTLYWRSSTLSIAAPISTISGTGCQLDMYGA